MEGTSYRECSIIYSGIACCRMSRQLTFYYRLQSILPIFYQHWIYSWQFLLYLPHLGTATTGSWNLNSIFSTYYTTSTTTRNIRLEYWINNTEHKRYFKHRRVNSDTTTSNLFYGEKNVEYALASQENNVSC